MNSNYYCTYNHIDKILDNKNLYLEKVKASSTKRLKRCSFLGNKYRRKNLVRIKQTLFWDSEKLKLEFEHRDWFNPFK